ncbi:MAG: hypothetical protein F9K23_14485 [Bacteroidetes bacterium]|nr:MAG: hypothetical protein F9K23_14485 [Bacteroidota bacterium]
MKIKLSKEAQLVISELSTFVDSKNTAGAGKRFKKNFLLKIKNTLTTFSDHNDCKYPVFKARGLRCFFIDKWVIAYKKEDDEIVVYVIVFGSLLQY